METKQEKKEIKIDLWLFYVLVASVIILLVATVSGWLLVAKVNTEKDKQAIENPPAVVSTIK